MKTSTEQLDIIERAAKEFKRAGIRFILTAHFPQGGGALFGNKVHTPNEDGQTLIDDLDWTRRRLTEGTTTATNCKK